MGMINWGRCDLDNKIIEWTESPSAEITMWLLQISNHDAEYVKEHLWAGKIKIIHRTNRIQLLIMLNKTIALTDVTIAIDNSDPNKGVASDMSLKLKTMIPAGIDEEMRLAIEEAKIVYGRAELLFNKKYGCNQIY